MYREYIIVSIVRIHKQVDKKKKKITVRGRATVVGIEIGKVYRTN